jgi:5'-methylthioadenosine phosphorylase
MRAFMSAHPHTSVQTPVIGIIGGSGIYEIDGLTDTRWKRITTPFGDPSDELFCGELNGQRVVFLPRHGRGHKRAPTDLNYRANICALKMMGVTEIISLSACGSLREDLAPGTFVIVDQFVDRTFARVKTFFEPGLVAHVSMAHPVCARLGGHIGAAASALGIAHAKGGTYLAMEGPQFSTLAESNLYRSWGCAVIGMTNMPEAKLAREAELCYATVAMVTDYDCWHEDHGAVTVDDVVRVLLANAGKAKSLVKGLIPLLATRREPCSGGCHQALDSAIITAPAARDPAIVAKLQPIVGRVLR